MASYNAANMPEFGSIGVDTMCYSGAGASAVEELGAAMATAVAYLRAMTEKGMDINDAAKQVRFRFSLGSNFFMEIAKIARRARTLGENRRRIRRRQRSPKNTRKRPHFLL